MEKSVRPKCTVDPYPTKWPADLLQAFHQEAARRTTASQRRTPSAGRVSTSEVIKERAELGMVLLLGLRIGVYNLLAIDRAMEAHSGTTGEPMVIPVSVIRQ